MMDTQNGASGADLRWTATADELKTIHLIAKRAMKMATDLDVVHDSTLMDFEMDIEAVHCNDVSLRLDELLAADDFNFSHDVFGIRNTLDRHTGKCGDCFLPRFARPAQARGKR